MQRIVQSQCVQIIAKSAKISPMPFAYYLLYNMVYETYCSLTLRTHHEGIIKLYPVCKASLNTKDDQMKCRCSNPIERNYLHPKWTLYVNILLITLTRDFFPLTPWLDFEVSQSPCEVDPILTKPIAPQSDLSINYSISSILLKHNFLILTARLKDYKYLYIELTQAIFFLFFTFSLSLSHYYFMTQFYTWKIRTATKVILWGHYFNVERLYATIHVLTTKRLPCSQNPIIS